MQHGSPSPAWPPKKTAHDTQLAPGHHVLGGSDPAKDAMCIHSFSQRVYLLSTP